MSRGRAVSSSQLTYMTSGEREAMHITRDTYDEELRPYYRAGRAIAWLAARRWGVRALHRAMRLSEGSQLEGSHDEEHHIPSRVGGHRIRVRVFRPAGAAGELPAMLYLHGGGYMMGVPEQHLRFFADIMARRDVAIIAPAYRLAIQHPFPAGFDDCYDTLLWMRQNAGALGIRRGDYVIAGHSAGGGLAAALAMKARDTGDVKFALQMPLYPMLDHRMVTESSRRMSDTPVWDSAANAFGWHHYLKGLGGDVPAYASPALNTDYTELPPAISFVGGLDPFRDEAIAYMDALEAAGVPTRFELFEGAFHGFEHVAPDASIARAAGAFLLDAFEEYFDRHVA